MSFETPSYKICQPIKTLSVIFILIFFNLFNFPNLFTIDKEAPFFIASSA